MKLDVTIGLVVAIYACFIKNGLSVNTSTLLPLTTKVVTTERRITTDNDTRESSYTLTSTCIIAKTIFINELGDDNTYVYKNEQTGTPLKVCGNTKTCCMPQAETRLHKRSEEQLKGDTRPLHIDLQKYGTTGATFKHLFRSILDRSYSNLDTMFKRTYESRYQNNSHVFKSLYKSLHQYFNGSELDLQDSVDSFFEKLFEKIYIMSKPWVVFDRKYQNCIFESTNYVKPFGDIQRKVAHQILRSFLASRVFLTGLKEGMEFATQMLKLRLGNGCSNAFMKMTQCSVCSGVPRSVKPCKKYCINVIKGCYVDTIIVQGMWNEFIDAMIALTSKIEGPFSMEAVIEPLGVKISEAIMAFQENQVNITNKVEERCGSPSLPPNLSGNDRRRKRRGIDDAAPAGVKTESKKLFSEFKAGTQKAINELKAERESGLPFLYNFNVNNQKAPSEFEKMLRETKASLTGLKDYWVKLSERWCNEERTTTDNSNCWNGRNTSGYHLDVVSDLVKDSENNPEVEIELKQNKNLILDQVNILERSIKLIRSALTGNTEQCVDSECDTGSGDEGSGDNGSGDEGSGAKELADGSGSGEPKPTPAESNCANSVTKDCVDTIVKTTVIQDNDIPYVPVKGNDPQRSTQNRSNVNAGSVILLLLCYCVAVIL